MPLDILFLPPRIKEGKAPVTAEVATSKSDGGGGGGGRGRGGGGGGPRNEAPPPRPDQPPGVYERGGRRTKSSRH